MKKIIIFIFSVLFSIVSFSEGNNESLELLLKEITEVGKEHEVALENNLRDSIITFAKESLNKPYSWGSVGPNKFDCSGFVKFVFGSKTDVELPRVSREMSKYNTKKDINDLVEGDLLFFSTSRNSKAVNHVGIYIGNGEFIHASSASKKVTISTIEKGFYKKTFKWAVSPFKD